MGFFESKRTLFLVILGLVFLGGLWSYTQFSKESIIRDDVKGQNGTITTRQEVIKKQSRGEAIGNDEGKVVFSESVVCGGDTYIFETVLIENQTYYNDVYKTAKSPENLIARLKPLRGGDLGLFSILATPKRNCDRIYLTTNIAETDAPIARIFVWDINEKSPRELAVSNEFSDTNIPFRGKDWISPDGERIIIAQQISPKKENRWCDYRLLRLINLREDTSKMLLQLSQAETFDNGYSDLDPYCAGLSFGWLNESTIYYDVYDVTKGVFDTKTESNRPFLKRRTLKIN